MTCWGDQLRNTCRSQSSTLDETCLNNLEIRLPGRDLLLKSAATFFLVRYYPCLEQQVLTLIVFESNAPRSPSTVPAVPISGRRLWGLMAMSFVARRPVLVVERRPPDLLRPVAWEAPPLVLRPFSFWPFALRPELDL